MSSRIVKDLSDVEYHADRTTLSASGAKLLLPPSTPAKFREAMDNPPPPKPVFDFGHLVHGLVLGVGQELEILDPAIHGLKADGTVAQVPQMTGAWKKADQAARAAGKLPVSKDDFEAARMMSNRVLTDKVAGPLFRKGEPEVSWYATDPDTGVQLRARPDWQTNIDGRPVIVDLKTTQDGNPDTLGRTADRYQYFLQAAWYITVAELLGMEDPDFLFVFVEKSAPYLVTVGRPLADEVAYGRQQMRDALQRYRDCTEADVWPGYEPIIHPMRLPPWRLNDISAAQATDLITALEGIA